MHFDPEPCSYLSHSRIAQPGLPVDFPHHLPTSGTFRVSLSWNLINRGVRAKSKGKFLLPALAKCLLFCRVAGAAHF